MFDYIKTRYYNESHSELKKEMQRLNKDYENLVKCLSDFNNTEIDLPIDKNALENFPLLNWVPINDKVKIMRKNNLFHYYLNFDCEMEEGGSLGKHFHKDLIESIEVIKGSIIDKHTNKVYEENDVIYYKRNQLHEPKALTHTFLKVLFKP